MVLNVFAVHDVKAAVYAQPIFLPMKGEAIRAFQDEVGNDKSMLHRHPADFSLYRLGTFDDKTGKLDSLSVPEFVVKASDFVAAKLEV